MTEVVLVDPFWTGFALAAGVGAAYLVVRIAAELLRAVMEWFE